MIVKRLSVRNYRALRGVTLDFGPLTYLVGRNGAGKSSILSALTLFFRQAAAGPQDFSLADDSQPIEIALTFDRLGPAAALELEKYVRNGELTVTKRILMVDGRLSEKYHGTTPRHPGFEGVRAEVGRSRIEAYRALRGQFGMPAANSGIAVDEALHAWELQHADALELGEDDGSFFGFTNVGTGKLDKYIDFVLVPAVRDAVVDATETRDSTLRRLVDTVVRRSLELDATFSDYRNRITAGYQEILQRPELSLNGLEARMTRSIERFAPGASVSLGWNEAAQPEIPSPTAIARLADDGLEGEIATKGHGLQRAYVMAALRALAEVEAERTEAGDNQRGLLLAVEEPELYQHPAQARHIAGTFSTLTEAPTGQVQIVACTHSPIFVDIRSFESIRVVRKRTEHLTNISQATLELTAAALNEAYQEDNRYSGQGLRPGLRGLLNPYLSEAFFSDFVVLVEGEEDKAVLEGALTLHPQWAEIAARAVVTTPVGGKKNLDKLVVILGQLQIPHYVVFDRDGEHHEAEADVIRTNRALQRLIGTPDVIDMPETSSSDRSTVFSPNLTQCVRNEVGEEAWLRYREEACEEIGLEIRTGVEKNPEIVRRMLQLSSGDDRSAPSVDRCADAIIRAVLAAYPPQ